MDTTPNGRADRLLGRIASALLAEQAAKGVPWDGLAVVTIVAPGTSSYSGYVYRDGERPVPAGLRSRELHQLFRGLNEAMRTPGGRTWVTALLQISRADQRLAARFEHDDPMRWKVTPRTLATLPEQMRPTPGR